MVIRHRVLWTAAALLLCQNVICQMPGAWAQSSFDVKRYGAKGNGKALDTAAINKTIDAAAAAGGGTVYFPAGTYLSVSIHLKSNIALYLDRGAILQAAPESVAPYDDPEPNPFDMYQDFGHSHFHNSLIWGENLVNVSILGAGMIDGKGLHSGVANNVYSDIPKGGGNKAIALKRCRNVVLRDFTILMGGHFAILATGVDNLTIDNLMIDTNRDGIDIDSCQNVRLSNTSVNSPIDDGICLKSSYALGEARPTENVTITNCFVSGYLRGTLLDGTHRREQSPDHKSEPTGRIKFGTESNGGFRNITITNCVFDYSRGLALETVDGGPLEDVTISNLTMRDITNAAIFIRLASRMRGPRGTPVGKLRRVRLSNIVVYNADPKYGSMISGVPGHPVEDIQLDGIHITYKGGGTEAQAALKPAEMEDGYPEPRYFGDMPAYGFYIRHAKGIEFHNVEVGALTEDKRPAFYLEDVQGVEFNHVKAQTFGGLPAFSLNDVTDFTLHQSQPGADIHLEKVEKKKM